MKTQLSEFMPIASPAARSRRERVRRSQESPSDHATPEAFDEIFANFAERQEPVERPNSFAFDAQRIRDMASDLERQRERLAKLLRDIDLSA
jgi:hypothetical protein